jgi:type IV pilus assembly protein PilM
MPSQGRPILGVDINPHEIRVVEMRGTWLNAQVIRAGAVPMPRGALEGGRVVYPDAVGDTLRGLLDRMKAGTRDAVLGVGAESIITRVLDIPRVPDSEVRMVIEGELTHYQIVREGTGVFDFMRLREPTQNLEANPQVLLMAAEERIVSSYREAADHAGLRLVALEPLLLAMYRAAYPKIQAQPSALCLSIGYGRSEIAIVDHGELRLYRRMDIGSDDLITGRQEVRPAGRRHEPGTRERILLSQEEEDFTPEMPPPVSHGEINSAAANSLALEVQRSLDYYRREYPRAHAIGYAVLATNDPELEPLGEWIKQALRLEMDVAEPPIAIGISRAIASQLEAPEGLRFLGASGLAMRELASPPSPVPRFDLAVEKRVEANIETARRRMSVALAISIAVVLVGIVGALTLGREADTKAHELNHRKSALGGIQQVEQQRLNEKETQYRQEKVLKMLGLPVPRIIDGVAGALAPEAGVTEVTLDSTGRLVISGDASNERAIITTLQKLKECPYFTNTSLDSFDSSLVNADRARIVRFQISSQLVGARPPGMRATGMP